MTARDRFTAKLVCPKCNHTGEAKLSQEDGWSYITGDMSTSVDHLPDGFKVVKDNSLGGVDIYCATCSVSAWR